MSQKQLIKIPSVVLPGFVLGARQVAWSGFRRCVISIHLFFCPLGEHTGTEVWVTDCSLACPNPSWSSVVVRSAPLELRRIGPLHRSGHRSVGRPRRPVSGSVRVSGVGRRVAKQRRPGVRVRVRSEELELTWWLRGWPGRKTMKSTRNRW